VDTLAPLLERLLDRRVLISTGVDGLYARSGLFESVVSGLESAIARISASDGAEVLRFPPAMTRTEFERSEYMKNFPQLAGTVHAFCGGDSEHRALLAKLATGEDWARDQEPTEIVLVPAACYPLYPMLAAEGDTPADGRLFDVQSYCFRHEPSTDPARMQLFRMREFVRIGSAEQILAFRSLWLSRAKMMISALNLPFEIVLANDPFFGRAGKLMKNNQLEQELKLELVIPIANSQPTACLSFNYHRDHFSSIWRLKLAGGELAHTGCVGFGLERIVLALFRHHGFEPADWPGDVRRTLWG
jgi:seryl-tRNA synthetase